MLNDFLAARDRFKAFFSSRSNQEHRTAATVQVLSTEGNLMFDGIGVMDISQPIDSWKAIFNPSRSCFKTVTGLC